MSKIDGRKVFHYGDGSIKRVESRKERDGRLERENRDEYWQEKNENEQEKDDE